MIPVGTRCLQPLSLINRCTPKYNYYNNADKKRDKENVKAEEA